MEREYLELRYAEGDRLFVPTEQVDRVDRYVGPSDHAPTLTRLGSGEWARTKERVRRAVDGLHVPIEAMQNISGMIAAMDYGERSSLPCIGNERADLVVAGCAILEAIMEIWPAKNLGVADRGIREGILRSLMARDGWQL